MNEAEIRTLRQMSKIIKEYEKIQIEVVWTLYKEW